MSKKDTILVRTSDTDMTRGFGSKELKIEVLTENVNLFLTQIESILEKTPDEMGRFKFTEFTVSAEISAQGKLMLLGSGV